MAKTKHPLDKSKNSPLVFSKRKNVKDDFTHNVQIKRLRTKKK